MILSHHRSGSNFLQELLQHHPHLTVISEPFSMHTDVFRGIDLVPWDAYDYEEPLLHRYLREYPHTVDLLNDLRNYLLCPFPGHSRGIKETLLFEKMLWLRCYLPTLKVILLVRDPRAVVYSVIRHNLHELWQYGMTIPRYLRDSGEDQPTTDCDLRTPVQLCAWSWKFRYQLAQRHLRNFESVTIRLEDLFSSPERHLESVMGFLQSKSHPHQWEFLRYSHTESRGEVYSTVRSTEHVLEAWKRGLADEERRYIESILNEEMLQLGYLQAHGK